MFNLLWLYFVIEKYYEKNIKESNFLIVSFVMKNTKQKRKIVKI